MSSSPTDAGEGRAETPFDFAPGDAFGDRYTIVERVGSGGMGQVYKALDRELNRPVALKLVGAATAGARGLERFRRELGLARQVSHPNVCRVHDIGRVGNVYYISMEFVEGQTLSDWIRAVGKLSPEQTVNLARQLCAALAAIHTQSIVHRDLKPGNVMLDRNGRAVVMDFGLAYQPLADEITGKGEVLGTYSYLSPEQAQGNELDLRSDIYALGLIIFEMLTGERPPADGKSLPLALRPAEESCPAPGDLAADVPESLDRIVMRCLARRPAQRYQAIDEIDRALEEAASDISSSATEMPRRRRSARRLRAGRLAAGLAAALLVALVVAVIVMVRAPAVRGPASVATLPLAYDGTRQSAYLADLLPLIILRNLQGSRDLELAPYDTSRSFGASEDPGSVARQLDVDWVLLGDIRVRGEAYQGALRLMRAGQREPSWSRAIAGNVTAVLDDADSVSLEIADALGVATGGSPTVGIGRQAYADYLEGKTLLEGWDVEKNDALAAEAFSRALDADPDFAEARAGLAMALWTQYLQTREPEVAGRAMQEAERAAAAGPSLPEAHLALGIVQLGRGLSVEAAASFEAALQTAPANDAALRKIADAYGQLRRTEEAEDFYDRAIGLRPDYWQGYLSKGNFSLRSGRLEEAKELFRKVIDLRPQSDAGYANLATTYLVAGELEEAKPLLESALRIQPTTTGYNNLGFVYYATGRWQDARQQFEAATGLSPDNPVPWGGLADTYRQLDLPREAHDAYVHAEELIREHLRMNPVDAGMRGFLAMTLAGLRRCADAGTEATNATKDAADNATVHYYAAVAYAICADYDAAAGHTIRALQGGIVIDVKTNPDLRPLLEQPGIRELLR